MNEKVKDILEWVICIIIAIVIALLIRYFVGTPTIVQHSSMYPTLKEDQRLILNRLPRTTKKMPKRGEIVTFEAPTKKGYTQDEVDLNNPVAKYSEIEGVWNKFTHYILEVGKESYIKRVIALPGEYVEIKDGKVYIDGKELDEPYLQDNIETHLLIDSVFTNFTVPENCVFAMGDNRPRSSDCRDFGCIPLDKIESRVLVRFWPFNVFGKVE